MILIERLNPHCIASIYLRVLHFNLFVIRWSDSVPNVLSRFHLSTEERSPKTTEIRLIKDWFRKESRSSKVEGTALPCFQDGGSSHQLVGSLFFKRHSLGSYEWGLPRHSDYTFSTTVMWEVAFFPSHGRSLG